jgi:hypothetical protein
MLSTLINITITYEGQPYNFQQDMNVKIENFINFFASNINMASNSIVLLYNGTVLKGEYLQKTIWQTMNSIDKQYKRMRILALKVEDDQSQHLSGPNDINILLIINEKQATRIKGKKGEPIKNIIQRAKIGKNKNYMKMNFNLRNKKIDLNKKFDDLADERDKQDKELIIKIDNIKVNFNYKNRKKSMYFPPQKKIR